MLTFNKIVFNIFPSPAMELPDSVKTYSQFLHPLAMWALFALTLYAMVLGIKVKKTRQASGDEKKELIKGRYNSRHFQIGSLVMALMVVGSLGGMAVTYINNGKLFVGPHLLAGLAMTAMIAVSAALSPLMQKGQNWARVLHVGINMTLVGLFGWQAWTGVEIVQKIIGRITDSAA
jgi:hypothetical protein